MSTPSNTCRSPYEYYSLSLSLSLSEGGGDVDCCPLSVLGTPSSDEEVIFRQTLTYAALAYLDEEVQFAFYYVTTEFDSKTNLSGVSFGLSAYTEAMALHAGPGGSKDQ